MTKNMQNKQDNVSMLLMKRTDSIAYNVRSALRWQGIELLMFK